MGVRYVFDGSIDAKFRIKFTLDNGATFKNDPALYLIQDNTLFGTTARTSLAGGTGNNYVEYEIDATDNATTTTVNSNYVIEPNVIDPTSGADSFELIYDIQSASALATPGQKINMKVTMMTPQPSYPVSPAKDLDIVESKNALTVKLVAETDIDSLDDRISVASGNVEFSNTAALNEATIGYLTITNNSAANGIKDVNGTTDFKPGATSNVTIDEAKTTFTITDGQFKASMESPGAVVLVSKSGTGTIDITEQATDESTVTFALTGSELEKLQKVDDQPFAIKIITDTKTDINVNENPPVAELHIGYDSTKHPNYAATTYPAVELRKIKQDGTRCVVYNVPAPGSADIVAVRVTNDSGIDGIVNATLYDGSGTEIFAAQPLNGGNAIVKGATLAVFNTDLAALGSWSGRAVLVLTTSLPSIEVLGLLREAGNNAAPLTNLSTGAMGDGCTN
jgi:hypothetical protein